MLYGSTMELAEQPNIKQPCLLFVFSDGIVAIRPPVGTVTHSMNEATIIRAMTHVYLYGAGFIERVPDVTAESFATTMSVIEDQAGKTVQTEPILASAITRAELSKNGLFGAKVTVEVDGRAKPLVLVGGKKAVKLFGGLLAQLLGDKFVSLLK